MKKNNVVLSFLWIVLAFLPVMTGCVQEDPFTQKTKKMTESVRMILQTLENEESVTNASSITGSLGKAVSKYMSGLDEEEKKKESAQESERLQEKVDKLGDFIGERIEKNKFNSADKKEMKAILQEIRQIADKIDNLVKEGK